VTAKNIKGKARAHGTGVPPAPPAQPRLRPWQTDLVGCVVIFAAVFILFHQIPLEGKSFSRGDDTESAASMTTFAREEARVREYPMWCPFIFGGFPSLAAGAYSNYQDMGMPYALAGRYLSPRYWADLISIHGLFLGLGNDRSDAGRWLLTLFLYGGLLTYLLLRRTGFSALIAVLGALLMAWNPYLISLATAAHGGKLMTFIYMPLVILCAWNVIEKRRFLDLSLLALTFGWQIAVGGHTQILFYSLLTVALIYVVWLIFELREKASWVVLKPAAYILIALILGFGVGSLWYIPLSEYLGYSIRGMGPAIAKVGAPSGYSLADATTWSFNPREIITFIVPSWFGLKSPFYWGDMPFTSSSFYFGVVPLLFAVLAFFAKKTRLFWGMVVVSAVSLLLSFGSHFQIFYGLFFNVVPFFNKFRTPSLILLLVVMAGIVFAAYGIRFVLEMKDNERWRKAFLYGAILCGALLVIVLLAGSSLSGLYGSFSRPDDARYYNSDQIRQLRGMRFDMLWKDLLLALFWLGVAFAACWAKLSGRIKANAFLIVILAVTVIDLWRFSGQFFQPQPAASTLETLRPNRVVERLKQEKGVFRVFPADGNLLQDNRWAVWEVASLGGYHGAKMRAWEDLRDNVLSASPDRRVPINMPFLSAMNCKYLITTVQLPSNMNLELVMQDPQTKWNLYRNPRALERVHFVDSIIVLKDRTETFRRLADPSFLWDYMAVVDRPLPDRVVQHPDRMVKITEYTPHLVRVTAHTPTASFLVFSDTYYAPGWTALDNGLPTTIYQVDGYVRGLYLRPGDHSIEFRYTGKYEKRGVLVATVSHFLVWGLVIGAFLYERKRRKAERA
jgi:hypothetical protein